MTEPAGSSPITVRAFDLSRDLDAWAAVHNQHGVALGTLQIPFATVESWRSRLVSDYTERALVGEIDGQVVGCIGYHVGRGRKRHTGTLGMGVDVDFQGRGVGSALMAAIIDLADNWYNLWRLELEVYTDNAAGIALYRKFGFEDEGVYRKFAFRGGRYVDALAMARLREDPWRAGVAEEEHES